MSRTIPTTLVCASQYTFVSVATSASIREVMPVPLNVYAAAREFFRHVIDGVEDKLPGDPVAAASAYALAARVARWIAPREVATEEETNTLLMQYAATLEAIGPGCDRSGIPAGNLDELAAFFDRLAEIGESEAYDGWFGRFDE